MDEGGFGDEAEVSTSAKVNVAVRLRPLIKSEIDEQALSHWYSDPHVIQQVDPVMRQHIASAAPHPFDHVFGSDKNTDELYKAVVSPIVNKAFEGFNGTILCYGQTSSGKTNTLYGEESAGGIISLTAEHIFKRINCYKQSN